MSILAAGTAALCFWKSATMPWLLVIAPLLCFLRLWFNMLDGMVAVAAGTASARGEILNDLPDRLSDIIIFAGVAQSSCMSILQLPRRRRPNYPRLDLPVDHRRMFADDVCALETHHGRA
jgi:phosphatidylglycerophosphate synthase